MEMKIWSVSEPVVGSRHSLKYSLFYGSEGRREIGYDKERGKGDLRHYDDREEPYIFMSPEALISDFLADVSHLRGGEL